MTHLSKRERQIMEILYKEGRISALEIMEKLPDPPGYATVRKLLGILEEKGQVFHTKSGRQFIYEPKTPKEKIKGKSLKHLLATFFQGSISEAVATFLDESDQKISLDELEELENLIQKAKRNRNNPSNQ
ncbi:MAG: BlaI/MecI/CopY family transcriptional regulator [Bacteroidota bacterium]